MKQILRWLHVQKCWPAECVEETQGGQEGQLEGDHCATFTAQHIAAGHLFAICLSHTHLLARR